MPQPLTVDDALDAIWTHTIDIASVAVAGKGSARMTASLTTNGDGTIRPTYVVITKLDGNSKVTNFNQQELDQAVTLYNSIVQWL